MTTTPNSNPPQTEKEQVIDNLLVELHDAGVHGTSLAELERTADFILERERALLDRLEAAGPEDIAVPDANVYPTGNPTAKGVNAANNDWRAAIKSEREMLG